MQGNYTIEGSQGSNALPNVSHHLAKGFYIYNFGTALSLGTTLRYASAKGRMNGDLRSKVDAYTTLDTALNYKNKKYNYSINLSAKNIFNADVRYSSPSHTYADDYVQERRIFLLSLKKVF